MALEYLYMKKFLLFTLVQHHFLCISFLKYTLKIPCDISNALQSKSQICMALMMTFNKLNDIPVFASTICTHSATIVIFPNKAKRTKEML